MITRKSLADEIDTYDQSIADLNSGKKDCFDAYRDQMLAAGVAKENVRKEIEAVKAAIRRRRLVAKDATSVEEKDALVDEVFAEICAAARAPRARVENIEEFPKSEANPQGPKPEPAARSADESAALNPNPQPTSSPEAETPVPILTAEAATGAESSPSAPVDDFEPPAFLVVKSALRPHCLEPHLCRSGTRDHCHHCKKAMAESEAA